eukprot:m.77450 g.77450  ORF g.77450 m.77450 type:complete len:427 (+) comp36032_c0_seq9:855-2135(+)
MAAGIVQLARRFSTLRTHFDVCIVGGGIMGSASAYFLAKTMPASSIVVIERDATYSKASTVLSVGSIRQQFSVSGNIHMSMYGADFLKNINKHLDIEDSEPCEVPVVWGGYLFLATSKGASTLKQNYELQKSMGAGGQVMSPRELSVGFPWLNTEDIALGVFGQKNEGWFDPWQLLTSFKKKAASMGVTYMEANATKVDVHHNKVNSIWCSPKSSDESFAVSCNYLVNCAGPWSSDVAEMAGIGQQSENGDGILSIGLPVRPRKRMVFPFKCQNGPSNICPLTLDPSGVYFRWERQGFFLSGKSPSEEQDKDGAELEIEHEFFDEEIWPCLAHRVPAFEALKVENPWAGYYDYNTFDQNGIIGRHPLISNFIFATGFSGHGIQQGPAVGRAVSEIITQGKSMSIDLDAFGFERIIANRPLYEKNIV